ncbi:50S ribosomal protein L4 [bacterium]|nr:MAG: 50S ribosomal protein L4 [bacterium]
MDIKLYNQEGKEVKDINLPEDIFGLEINHDLLHQSYLAQKNNKRDAIANTKTRKDVRGGGKKPWKQKGTGRARASSIRSPLWKGGGVTFGPTNERNFSQKINKKMKKKAILMAISSKFGSSELMVIDNIVLADAKTKLAKNIVENLVIKEKTLIVQPSCNDIIQRSFRNIPRVKTILANSLNVVDLLEYKRLIVLEEAISVIKKTFIIKA